VKRGKWRMVMLAGLLAAGPALGQSRGGGVTTSGARTETPQIQGSDLPGGMDAIRSGADSRRALSITVYGNDIALVRDARQIPLLAGVNRVSILNVPETVSPGSVRLDTGDGVSIGSRRFETGQLSRERLLQAYVGREVLLLPKDPQDGMGTRRKAHLLGVADGEPVLEIGSRVEVAGPDFPWRLAFENAANVLPARPRVLTRLTAEDSRAQDLTLTYLARGIGWQADYDLVLAKQGAEAKLSAWATIRNDTGEGLGKANVELVAGTVRSLEGGQPAPQQAFARKAQEPAPYPLAGAYHVFALPAVVDLPAHTSRQVPLLAPRSLSVERHYHLAGNATAPLGRGSEPEPVTVSLSFSNAGDAAPPLPAGVVRVYQRGADGDLRWLGDDRLGATPGGANATLTVGQAFDVQAVRTRTDFKRRSEHQLETAWSIRLRNTSAQSVKVAVDEHLNGDWKLLESSQEPSGRDAETLKWQVSVPAGGQSTLTYRVSVQQG